MENLWLKDINLHSIADKIDNYEIFSFDIFDTVIFRSVDKPKEIYFKRFRPRSNFTRNI